MPLLCVFIPDTLSSSRCKINFSSRFGNDKDSNESANESSKDIFCLVVKNDNDDHSPTRKNTGHKHNYNVQTLFSVPTPFLLCTLNFLNALTQQTFVFLTFCTLPTILQISRCQWSGPNGDVAVP